MCDAILQNDPSVDKMISGRRLYSLDASRGLLIVHMVMGNSPGNWKFTYPVLTHLAWNGLSVADVVPAGFLWLMGVCMPFVLQRRLDHVNRSGNIYVYILRRSAIIFLIGFALNVVEGLGSPTLWTDIKILGVLQRIGLSYLIAALLFVTTGLRGHVVWIFTGQLVYWLISSFIAVPGFGAGNLSQEGNAAAYIDFLLLGRHGGNPHSLLSLLTATVTISYGILTGFMLRSVSSGQRRLLLLFLVGAALLSLGEFAGQWMPINRRLWTPSFVTATAGMLTMLICTFHMFIDVLNYRKWAMPLVVFGLNPLFIFSFSELGRLLTSKKGVTLADGRWFSLWDYIYRMFFLRLASPLNASLLQSTAYAFVFFLLATAMYRKGLFIKI